MDLSSTALRATLGLFGSITQYASAYSWRVMVYERNACIDRSDTRGCVPKSGSQPHARLQEVVLAHILGVVRRCIRPWASNCVGMTPRWLAVL
jgi:hypothetical protein